MDELLAMFTERWYVLAFLATFLVIATAERGWLRTALWLATGTFIGWLVEFSSTRNGFPFGNYDYNQANFPDELFIGGVPLFASLSFAFLTYFGYSAACTLLSPLERANGGLVRLAGPALDNSFRVLLLAAVVTTWVDTVVDPVTHLGRYWFIGDLYAYDTNGFHFDVPLSNYAGWLFTSALIVLVNQGLDALLNERGVPARGFALPYKPLWAVATIVGDMAFIIGIAIYLLGNNDVPSSENVGAVLASGIAISVAFIAFAAFMLRRGLSQGEQAASIAPAEAGT